MKLCDRCDGEGVIRDGVYKACPICGGHGLVNIPEYIYLQFDPGGETTWSDKRINDNDLEYRVQPPNYTLERNLDDELEEMPLHPEGN